MSGVIETLQSLVRINSVNPAYEGGPGEQEIALWIRRFFEERGIEVVEQLVFPGRSNVIARVRGCDPSRRIVLEAHMDTVSVQGMSISPFEPRIEAGRLYGRGSCDTKAGLAAMMHAVASIHSQKQRPHCDVLLAAVVDEEHAFRGVVRFCEGLSAEAAIVAEPTELRAVIASKGVLRWRIIVRGRAAHSSKPHLGVNAINGMARVVLAIEDENRRLGMVKHPLLGPATCNVGVIRGGVQVNFVPDECVIEIDRRLLPGEHSKAVLSRYQDLLDQLAQTDADFEAFMETPMLVDEALQTRTDAPAVRLASQLLDEMQIDPTPCGVPFGSDASKLSRQGIPSLIIGPGSIDRAHAASEYVEVEQVEQAFEFYRQFCLRFVPIEKELHE